MRFSDRRGDRLRCEHLGRSASHVLGRHYRVLPQRLVVGFELAWREGRVCGAKPPFRVVRVLRFRSRLTGPRASVPRIRRRPGEPGRRRSRSARSGRVSGVSVFGRSRRPALHTATGGGVPANELTASFTRPRAEARGRVLLRGCGRDRSSARGDEGPCWRLTAEAVCVREGPAGLGRRAVPPRWNVSRPWSRGAPPTAGPPRWRGGTRHAAGIRRRLSWSLFPFGV
jgi:hypothetical protein